MRHDFDACLEFSRSQSARAFMERVYRDYWPDHQGVLSNDVSNAAQRSGTDRLIMLGNAKSLRIEEKIRKGYWRDVLLEYISNSRTRAPGWVTKDNGNDYLVYALPEAGRYWMLPQEALYRRWQEKGELWLEWADRGIGGFKIKESETETSYGAYKSQSVAVPEHVMIAEFGRGCLRTLPIADSSLESTSANTARARLKPLVSLRPVSPQLGLDLDDRRRR